jgi:hypothetical protein
MARYARSFSTTGVVVTYRVRPKLLPGLFSDTVIVTLLLTPSALEVRTGTDSSVVLLTLTPSVIEVTPDDQATVQLTLTPSATEARAIRDHLLEGTLSNRWDTSEFGIRYFGISQDRWDGSSMGHGFTGTKQKRWTGGIARRWSTHFLGRGLL